MSNKLIDYGPAAAFVAVANGATRKKPCTNISRTAVAPERLGATITVKVPGADDRPAAALIAIANRASTQEPYPSLAGGGVVPKRFGAAVASIVTGCSGNHRPATAFIAKAHRAATKEPGAKFAGIGIAPQGFRESIPVEVPSAADRPAAVSLMVRQPSLSLMRGWPTRPNAA